MLKKLKLNTAFIILAALLMGGCAKNGTDLNISSASSHNNTDKKNIDQTIPASQENTNNTSDTKIYPLKGSHTLTYWVKESESITTPIKELPVWQELMTETGIEIEFINISNSSEKEQFDTMIASGNYPDIIESKIAHVGDLYNKNIIMDLTDIMPEYSPNYYNYLCENPDIMKQVKSDDGKLLLYAFLRPNPIAQTTTGPIIRKDWLDKVNLAVPETIEDWENMLNAFKNELNAEIPLGTRTDLSTVTFLASAWNIYLGFYHDDNIVKYGYLEDNFVEYLQTMVKWYENGLLDKNFTTATKSLHDENMLSDKIGATFGALSGQFGTWLSKAKQNGNTEFDLTGAKFPVLNKGDIPAYYDITQFEYSTDNPWCMISTQCKDIEAAARLLDYTYSKEGSILMNFGIEGKTYRIVNNEIQLFSDEEILSMSDGVSVYDWKNLYTRVSTSGPFILDNTFSINSYTPQQYDALNKWVANENKEHKMPPIILLAEENIEYNAIMKNIESYVTQMLIKFITGTQNATPANISIFQDNIRSMNISRALEIQQTALDRYNTR